MEARLRQALARAEEVANELAHLSTASDPAKLRALGQEHTRLAPIVQSAERLRKFQHEFAQAREMADEADPELAAMVKADLTRLPVEISRLETELHDRDTIVEIRAGTGGDEAALFAADLSRMYQRFVQRKGLTVEPISLSEGTAGGIKEAIFAVRGPGAFGLLRREAGVHRVQRVPATETQGRIHTSAATVAILPEAEEVDGLRPRRAEREHHRQCGAYYPPSDRAGGVPAGSEVAAAEQAQGDGSSPGPASRPQDQGAGGCARAGTAVHGGYRRSLGQDPDV